MESYHFGVSKIYGTSSDTFYYNIIVNDSLDAYKDDNPSLLYKFYYVVDVVPSDDGYLKDNAVYSLEIRYEVNSSSEYMLKIFIENAKKSHNGIYNYKYKLKN